MASTKITDQNRLSNNHSNVLLEWDYDQNIIKPEQVSFGSHKKVWWICSKNHQHKWCSAIKDRTLKKRGCPYCSNNKLNKERSLAIKFPEIAKEWHPTLNGKLTPHDIPCRSNKKAWWMCSNNNLHVWEAAINNRTNKNRVCNCPYCNKIELKNGIYCSSIPDAIKCVEYLELNLIFKYNKKYPNSKFRYDFYFPNENKYVEVTSFNKKAGTYRPGFYFSYLRKIVKKRKLVENILKANFEFIQFIPTQDQLEKLKTWTK